MYPKLGAQIGDFVPNKGYTQKFSGDASACTPTFNMSVIPALSIESANDIFF